MNSVLIRMDISKPQPECHTLVHAVNGIEDDGNQSYFNCIINDNEIPYLGDFNDCIKYDNENIDRLIFDNFTPSPGFIRSSRFTDHGHFVYGALNGIIINSENEILAATRVFKDRDSANSVDGIHGIGKSFLVAVIRMGNLKQFDGIIISRLKIIFSRALQLHFLPPLWNDHEAEPSPPSEEESQTCA